MERSNQQFNPVSDAFLRGKIDAREWVFDLPEEYYGHAELMDAWHRGQDVVRAENEEEHS